MDVIAENIKNFRIFRGLSQRELGDKLNKSSAVICNWEKGINSPDLDSIANICRILQCTPNELFGWDVNKDLKHFLEKKQYLLQELQKLTKARDALDKQIMEYYKQMEQTNPEIDINNPPDSIDLENMTNAMKRRVKFTDSSKHS